MSETSFGPGSQRGFTLRAVLVTLILAWISTVWMKLDEIVSHTIQLGESVPVVPAVAALCVFLLLNPLLARIHPRLALRKAELMVVFVMMSIIPTISSVGMMRMLLPATNVASYFATPENKLAAIWDLVPQWYGPRDPEVIRQFYEGATDGRVPWGPWAVADLEFRRMFSNPLDPNNCFLDIQSGTGGTEAQDWASMLERMYLRFCERRGFTVEVLEESPGEVAGIKSASLKVSGEYAYGILRTETGVHRLVRKSPFDSGNRRHTSFAAVFVSPEIEDDIQIEINPADLRIDVYRASGAGGQHVNRTESAVRITHLPTGVVVQCQNERSQHKNKATAMKQLKAKLYQLEEQKRRADTQALEDSKADVGWGSQIRSYVLDQSRIKDLRTMVEAGNPDDILDGDLDRFIEASLKQGL